MCITERQTVMDKELDYGQTEERDRKKARAGKTGTYIFLSFWALVVLFPFYWMLGILHVLGGTIRGTGKTMQAMVVFLVSLCGFRVMWIAGTMAWTRSLGHVMMCYPTSWLLGMLLMLLYVWKGKWMDLYRSQI